jgi:decaprenyl-phosphate phosphoribosyltransferase
MRKLILGVVAALRPKQWTKNFLLFVAPFAAGVEFSSDLWYLFLGFLAFCAASSIGYVWNDLNDISIDRLHPKKSLRPFAAGVLSFRTGIKLIVVLTVLLFLLVLNLRPEFMVVVMIYLFNTFLYTTFFKTIPVIEMFSVAFGFILRLISGALVMGLEISEWFLIVGGFGALFVVSAKRLAEFKQAESRPVRKVINEYTSEFLYSITSISVAVSVTAYCIWAFTQERNPFWYQISVLPFVMGFFRYRWMSEKINVEVPEDAILKDRSLLSLSACLILSLTVAIFNDF